MAVLFIEIFAQTIEETSTVTHMDSAGVYASLYVALAPLSAQSDGPLPLLGYEITPYDGAALIEARCLATSGAQAVDILAARLEAVMSDSPSTFNGWSLHAGRISVEHADN
ncbi:hypothetical protein FHX37_2634 [Haloactinospora alba]|uniref:Uncharacterized protein n=1 Tax=Haloactinospora alba TaxID=405555 RepID=A0A543NLH8_9ACTN|nr:hypothetical protein [Haloactinospora alba]TQN32657.1 hypothetical protein FHX37_2634 [Haloactinospora alba]